MYFKDKTIEELTFTKSGENLHINYGGSSDAIYLYNWFTSGYEDKRIDTIKDKNGNLYSIDELITIKGDIDANTVIAETGDDVMNLTSNLPTKFIFSSGDGTDTVNTNSTNNSLHSLKFTDKSVGDMTFGASGNALSIAYGENDSVTLNDWFNSNNYINKVVDSADVDYSAQLAQLHSDVASWMSTHTGYADVSTALADTGNTDVAQLVAIFENFNA